MRKTEVEKNWPSRRMIAGIFTFPMMALFAVVLLTPVYIFQQEKNFALLLAGTLVSEILAILWAKNYAWKEETFKETLYLNKTKMSTVIYGALAGIGFFVLLQVFAALFVHFGVNFGSSETSKNLLNLSGPVGAIITFVVTPFVVPVLEECVFRGVILHSFLESTLKNKKSCTVFSVIFSSLLFSLAHVQGTSSFNDWFLLAWIAAIAVVNAVFVVKTKSIYPAIALHVCYNTTTAYLSLFIH